MLRPSVPWSKRSSGGPGEGCSPWPVVRHMVVLPVLTPKVVAQLGATPRPRPPLELPHGANRSSFDRPGSGERPADSGDRHQLVRAADIHLAQMRRNLEHPISTPRWHESIDWMVCADCGARVFGELFGPEGAGECEDGGIRCTECRFADEDYENGLSLRPRPPRLEAELHCGGLPALARHQGPWLSRPACPARGSASQRRRFHSRGSG
jgi:DNA-directed RNA polymerase subunit RPC12/RpoP